MAIKNLGLTGMTYHDPKIIAQTYGVYYNLNNTKMQHIMNQKYLFY